MIDKYNRIHELVDTLHKACIAYYKDDNPIMSDKEYDDLYDELETLENETGIVLSGSPTQRVQGYILDGFSKVEHSKPMLSAAKTKDPEEIKRFLGRDDFYASYKLDGLTTILKYHNGKLVQGITRGTGTIGEDVTEQCKCISNVPLTIPYTDYLELRGETVISYDEFQRINNELEKPYSHPRNLASGTLRNLDLNIVKQRKLSFVVFEVVSPIFKDKFDGLMKMKELGFEVVKCKYGSVDTITEEMQPESYKYPVDGLIFELNDYDVSVSKGATGHHEGCRMALKWNDNLYETILTGIEWNTSRTGLVNPVALFDPVDLDGAITTRATLHNVSYIENLQLGIGDTIQIYRSNMVIPKVHDNLTRSNTFEIPSVCPTCGSPTEIHNDNGSKTVHCTNPYCKAKLISRLINFVSRKGMNIDGLSDETLTKFVEWGWVNNLSDIYVTLSSHFPELRGKEGFGDKSVKKLGDAIEKSKTVDFHHFITALGIPGIGSSQAKELSNAFQTWDEFEDAGRGTYDFTRLNSFGDVLNHNIHTWFHTMMNEDKISQLKTTLNFVYKSESTDKSLTGLTFVITGSLNNFENRDALKKELESHGAKVSGSISKKTSYLINNDISSNSSKNLKAKQLNIPIVDEEYIIGMLSK